jgi:hypothetical protein
VKVTPGLSKEGRHSHPKVGFRDSAPTSLVVPDSGHNRDTRRDEPQPVDGDREGDLYQGNEKKDASGRQLTPSRVPLSWFHVRTMPRQVRHANPVPVVARVG